MSIRSFIKDTYPYLFAAAFALVIIGLFLQAFSIPPHAILFVLILLFALFFFIFAREYGKRKRYYGSLLRLFDKLDKKFLITELMEEGGFSDSAILYDMLRRAGKSMNDEIAFYRLQAGDYAEFLEGWVHEIKTPIASARLTIQNNPGEAADRIGEDLARIERYVQNVLYYARSSIVEKDYLIKQVTLDLLVKKALKENSRLLIGNKTAVRMENLDITVYTDEKWVLFILGQIIANSVKYTAKENASLTFSGEDGEGCAVLTIADNGIGIPPADLPRIFEKGYTGENGRRFSKSTGMGLYLCKKLCGKLGIDIVMDSESGTKVSLSFPKTDLFFRG